jgi:hypothetical protein
VVLDYLPHAYVTKQDLSIVNPTFFTKAMSVLKTEGFKGGLGE